MSPVVVVVTNWVTPMFSKNNPVEELWYKHLCFLSILVMWHHMSEGAKAACVRVHYGEIKHSLAVVQYPKMENVRKTKRRMLFKIWYNKTKQWTNNKKTCLSISGDSVSSFRFSFAWLDLHHSFCILVCNWSFDFSSLKQRNTCHRKWTQNH